MPNLRREGQECPLGFLVDVLLCADCESFRGMDRLNIHCEFGISHKRGQH